MNLFSKSILPVHLANHIYRVAVLLNAVKEIDGKYIWTAVTLDRLWWLNWPGEWKDLVKKWVKGEGTLEEAERRITEQFFEKKIGNRKACRENTRKLFTEQGRL